MNDISQGILAVIDLHGVTRLVMGAAADKHYSKKMKTPKSKKAIRVMEKADPFFKIWFVCKGVLICTREDLAKISAFPWSPAPSSIPGSISGVSDQNSALSHQQGSHEERANSTLPVNCSRRYLQRCNQFTASVRSQSQQDNMNTPKAVDLICPWDGIQNDEPSDSRHILWTAHDDLASIPGSTNDTEEAKQRQGVEAMLIRERQENEHLRSQIDEIYNKLQEAEKRKIENEQRIIQLEDSTKELEDKLLGVQPLIQSQKVENDNLQCKLDDALNELDNMQAQQITVHNNLSSNEFSFDEIMVATRGFAEDLKIAEGNFGIVYRGLLRNTLVAMKVLHWDGMQRRSKFHREVAIQNMIRHPNFVTLIGTCPVAYTLVYEYLPNGSLEDRLAYSNNTLPLPWQARTRIIGEICSGLIFLHSNQPHPVVHGDLKLENILLDSNLVSKISNFKCTSPYMDSELISTAEVTTQTDVHSFGIIIMRFLTGWQSFNISNRVEEEIQSGNLHSVIDSSAGEWPFVQANQLAHLGLRCIELSRMKCADLMTDVWQVIKPMMQVAAMSASPLSFASASADQNVPSYFMCPIFQEIMRDPHIAADGFTYEAEAIRGWFSSGHDTSPMTNLKLANKELVPNRALRSAILEWFPNLSQ
ncbi:hypothetical protein LUZ63_002122 [Rhynchospora breviuscula]|uniref:RING-type E3 ubiquitin transferase n=1 Tax=Rhynchospora breviuscula TaxID=2022672 RepID=A0A9Q0HYJ7_9POAL|nr:hypothetical protein LUZ63_002122 [Rhynchospora breviuscula]